MTTTEAPEGYVGRHRMLGDEAAELDFEALVCEEPDIHDQLERAAAQELRLPAIVPEGHCTFCGGRR